MARVMTPSTTVYSAMVWPSSHPTFVKIVDGNFPPHVSGVRACCDRVGLQEADHALEGAVDAPGKKAERHHDAERDHGENHAVLSHRLALLLAVVRLRELEPLGERHVGSPPFERSARAEVDA